MRFADLRSVTRSLTLSAPISATRALAEIAEDLVRGVLADHRAERTISVLAISVSNLDAHAMVQLELPLGLADEGRRPGTKNGLARSRIDRKPCVIRLPIAKSSAHFHDFDEYERLITARTPTPSATEIGFPHLQPRRELADA